MARSTQDRDEFLAEVVSIGDGKTPFETTMEVVPDYEGELEIVGVSRMSGEIREGERAGQKWESLNFTLEVIDPSVAEKMGVERAVARHSFFLDRNESGGLDMGKNRNMGLKRLLDAAGFNPPPKGFTWGAFQHARVWGQVKKPSDENANMSEVVRVARHAPPKKR